MKKNVTLLLSTILLASFFASCGLFDPIPKEEKQDNEPHFLTQIEMGGNNFKKGSFKDKIEISNDTVRRTFETIKPATTDELQLKYASLMGWKETPSSTISSSRDVCMNRPTLVRHPKCINSLLACSIRHSTPGCGHPAP